MMRIFSYLFSFLVLGLGTVSAQGVISLTDLKQMVREGLVEVNEDLFVEGVVINIFACGNLEVARNDTYTSLSTSDDNRTMYVQSFDGNEGIGLHFIASKFANVPQCSKVRVNLKGTRLKLIRGVGLSAYDLGESAVVSVEPGTRDDIVVKEKTVAELTDNDVFTYVRIKDCASLSDTRSTCRLPVRGTEPQPVKRSSAITSAQRSTLVLIDDFPIIINVSGYR